jgi:hypothetical protein
MSVTVGTPAQVPADAVVSVASTTTHKAGAHSVTKTTTLKKLTPNGTTGTIVEVNGVVTSYTPPT